MDRDYIELCAEMAYNEVIIMESLNENYGILQEGAIIDKIKSIASAILTAIKKFFSKVFDFFTDLINKIKNSAAVQKIKQKVAEIKSRKSKNEAASYYNRMMSLLLEENLSYDVSNSMRKNEKKDADRDGRYMIDYNMVFDHMRKITDPILKASYGCQSNYLNTVIKDLAEEMKSVDASEAKDLVNISDNDIKEAKEEIEKFKSLKKWGISFKYVNQFNKDNSIIDDRLPEAISLEYIAVKDAAKRLDLWSVKDDNLISVTYSLGIDKYASYVSEMFKDAKKALEETTKMIDTMEKEFTSALQKIDSAGKATSEISMLFKEAYNVSTIFEKACVSSARVFGKMSAEVVSQDYKLLANFN